jgi:septal ring factor EnvC (AmiA/AmiB activator)
MNIFLILLIAFKLVCLFFCWKAMSMAKKKNQNKSHTNLGENTEDIKIAQDKITELMKQNQKLSDAIEEMKESSNSTKSKRTS